MPLLNYLNKYNLFSIFNQYKSSKKIKKKRKNLIDLLKQKTKKINNQCILESLEKNAKFNLKDSKTSKKIK